MSADAGALKAKPSRYGRPRETAPDHPPGPPARDADDPSAGIRTPFRRVRRWLFFGAVTLTVGAGTLMMVDIVGYAGTTAIELAILALFVPTFAWIALAFWNALVGFVLQALGRNPLSLEPLAAEAPEQSSESRARPAVALESRTALVMPAYNENPERVVGGLGAMIRSLDATGAGAHFDVFLLSDTTDPAIAAEEEREWNRLRSTLTSPDRLRYRRRSTNTDRKAGNIADFCERWAADYDFMVVLDADSIMSGPTLVELARRMEANPDVGLIQTVPIPARQDTLFGRLLQFAARLYSPMLAAGQAFWQMDAGNYWGHNAIIRARAFVEHCGLPVLRGRPPMGGAILSHDFVEAALLRRAGWKVYMLPWLRGSYEEVPGDVVEYAKRDRRWSQGSLQHLRLLSMKGLHPMSRLHFVLGAMGYVSSLLWLLMLLASTAYVLLPLAAGAEGWSWGPAVGVDWPLPPVSEWAPLLGVTAVLLFLPKLLGLVIALGRERPAYGGAVRLIVGGVLETVFAVVVAPLMMMYHSRFVVSVLAGRDIVWEPPLREGRALPWRESVRRAAGVTLVGLVWGGATLYYSPLFFVWLSPIFAGLLLAAPLVRWTSSHELGAGARRAGLFLVPSETERPAELELALGSSREIAEPDEPVARPRRIASARQASKPL